MKVRLKGKENLAKVSMKNRLEGNNIVMKAYLLIMVLDQGSKMIMITKHNGKESREPKHSKIYHLVNLFG